MEFHWQDTSVPFEDWRSYKLRMKLQWQDHWKGDLFLVRGRTN